MYGCLSSQALLLPYPWHPPEPPLPGGGGSPLLYPFELLYGGESRYPNPTTEKRHTDTQTSREGPHQVIQGQVNAQICRYMRHSKPSGRLTNAKAGTTIPTHSYSHIPSSFNCNTTNQTNKQTQDRSYAFHNIHSAHYVVTNWCMNTWYHFEGDGHDRTCFRNGTNTLHTIQYIHSPLIAYCIVMCVWLSVGSDFLT